MNHINNICVFCGSSFGNEPAWAATARVLGTEMAARGHGLVYGGGNMGIMGELARAVMAGQGKVTGIIPERLNGIVQHTDLTELLVTPGMHERKARMYELSDAFIIMPGGIGTMEEFFETWTWQQLGYHQKPLGLLNVAGFFEPLIALIDHLVSTGFFKSEHRHTLIVETDACTLLEKLKSADIHYHAKLPERQ